MPIVPINLDGTLRKEDIIVGIDLGTTNSLIAIADSDSGRPRVLKGKENRSIVPSLIHFGPDDNVIVGDNARHFLVDDPSRTIYSVKRLMGKSYKDVGGNEAYFSYKIIDDNSDSLVRIRVGDKFYTPIELSAIILKELKFRAEQELLQTIKKAVITVPAYFNDTQRQATRDAGKLAGLEVLRIVNEPTAASLAYGLDRQGESEKIIAVYDLGGGTFDISILRLSSGIHEVLATNGDTYLGGDDFDRAITDHWVKEYNLPPVMASNAESVKQELRLLAEDAKKDLTSNEETSKLFVIDDHEYNLSLNRETLKELIQPFIDRTLVCCRAAVSDSGVSINEIEEVVMVGGSTRSQAVKDEIGSFFKYSRLHDEIDPDEVVALGAAIEADILAGKRKDMLLLDVTPLSLGIETLGGLMDVLIPRNSKVPTSVGKQYTTSVDGQVNMKINVFQGERELVDQNRKLAEFDLKGIPAMPAGLPKVQVNFLLDADGILRVDATELRSGVKQHIEVKPQYGLTDANVEQMLMDSLTHASEDVSYRMLVEAKTEGTQLIYLTERFISKHAEMLSDNEIQQTTLLINDLKNSLESNDKDSILGHIDELNEYTRPFAERLMDHSISQALKGKKIE